MRLKAESDPIKRLGGKRERRACIHTGRKTTCPLPYFSFLTPFLLISRGSETSPPLLLPPTVGAIEKGKASFNPFRLVKTGGDLCTHFSDNLPTAPPGFWGKGDPRAEAKIGFTNYDPRGRKKREQPQQKEGSDDQRKCRRRNQHRRYVDPPVPSSFRS